jgi:hypothetical protein
MLWASDADVAGLKEEHVIDFEFVSGLPSFGLSCRRLVGLMGQFLVLTEFLRQLLVLGRPYCV